MSDPVAIALITGVTAAIPTLLVSILNHMKTRADIKVIKTDINKVELATNSMKDALVKAAEIAGHAQGMKDQRDASSK